MNSPRDHEVFVMVTPPEPGEHHDRGPVADAAAAEDEDLCVAVLERDLVVRTDGDGWRLARVAELGLGDDLIPIGALGGTPVWTGAIDAVPAGCTRVPWLACLGHPDRDLALLVARGMQLTRWRRDHRYCGRCRTELIDVLDLFGRQCPGCGHAAYVKAQPVALIAVWRRPGSGHGPAEVLLARHTYGGSKGMWALVGGYVDPAETFEQAAHREVAEEVGLAVTDLVYYGSEAWGLSGPDVLLSVFTARSTDPGAEPVVDGHELGEARFFPVDQLPPELPPAHLIAARVLADLSDRL